MEKLIHQLARAPEMWGTESPTGRALALASEHVGIQLLLELRELDDGARPVGEFHSPRSRMGLRVAVQLMGLSTRGSLRRQ